MLSKLREKFAGLSGEQGFTLIELMIVIAVIGILAAIALPQFANVKDNANLAQAKSEMKNIQTALEMHFANNQEYPTAGELESIEGVSTDVIENYAGGEDASNYTRQDEGESYTWTYSADVGDTSYSITIDSTGTFDVQNNGSSSDS